MTEPNDASAPRDASVKPQPRSSFLTRIAPSLTPKSRHISDLLISPTDPLREYGPDDVIKGSINFIVEKPVRITHLTLRLYGFVKIFKHVNYPGAGTSSEVQIPSSAKRRLDYQGTGFVSLLEREILICGEGSLPRRKYNFLFEIAFPSTPLPSSLDFEKGTISYVLEATITRPVAMNQTLSCDRRVQYKKPIDIGILPNAKPRMVSLEPVTKRRRLRGLSRSGDSRPRVSDAMTSTNGESSRSALVGSLPVRANTGSVRDPSPSATIPSVTESIDEPSGANSDQVDSSPASDRSIKATIEITKTGYLSGEAIPIKITIEHTKPVNRLHGVVITLYRVGRIDPSALAEQSEGKSRFSAKAARETLVKKLSLGPSHSGHVFRKDIAQTFAPLVIDPITLTTTIKTALMIPDDTLETVSEIPGDMIEFSYQLEVILDLQGKLSGQDRFLPRMTTHSSYSYTQKETRNTRGISMSTGLGEQNFLDTQQIRREKGVVYVTFEIVIGTHDSTRRADRQILSDDEAVGENGNLSRTQYISSGPASPIAIAGTSFNDFSMTDPRIPTYDEVPASSNADFAIPPPEINHNEDEKTRMLNAERALLPSAPPQDDEEDEAESSTAATAEASVPTLEDLHQDQQDTHTLAPPYVYDNRPLAQSSNPARDANDRNTADDKQALELRRIAAEAAEREQETNVPNGAGFAENRDEAAGSAENDQEQYIARLTSLTIPERPIEPVIGSDDREGEREEDAHANAEETGAEHLPQYER